MTVKAPPDTATATRDVRLRDTDPVTLSTEYAVREIRSLSRRARQVARNGTVAARPTALRLASVARRRGQVGQRNSLISEALVSYTAKRLTSLRIFNPTSYLELNPTLRGKVRAPARHAVAKGAVQAVQVFRPEAVAAALGSYPTAARRLPEYKEHELEALASKVGPVSILVSSCGNVFMNEIADSLAEDLRGIGLRVDVRDERANLNSIDATSIVVAPHEFFLLGRGLEWISDSFVRNTFVYNTEQLQTPWFARALPWVLGARGVMDICPQVPSILRAGGIPAVHVEPSLGYRPRWLEDEDFDHAMTRSLPWKVRTGRDVAWNERYYDLSFFGNQSPRRDDILARHATRFSGYEALIYYTRRSTPIGSRTLTRLAGHVASQSRILLNIHRDEFPYFEWHRIVGQGMASKSVVVTDTCLPHPVYKPGVHFFQTEARHLPDLVDWLLRDEDGHAAAMQVLGNVDKIADSVQYRSSGAVTSLEFMAANL